MLIEMGGTELLMLTNNDGVSCAFIASQNGHLEALRMLIEADEVQVRRSIAFAMGLQERLGAASVVRWLEPGVLRMVAEFA